MRAVALSILFALVACAPEAIDPDAPLSADVDFEPSPGSQWYDAEGQPVAKDSGVISAFTGPDHCGWEDGVMLHLGWPLGQAPEDAPKTKQYFRDPKRVFPQGSLVGRFDGDVDLPEAAEDTGYRTDFMELWLEPEDDSAVYLVFADHTERWPLGKSIYCG
jgi:hypothetical protein